MRHAIASLMNPIDKVVVSDHLTEDELAPWHNTPIVSRQASYGEIARLEQRVLVV